ncbi:MAG: sulfite reductase [Dehalococcoidia bacterium]|nr:MAG: sulfite reductase [Dehalococcoidia bacterium]
MKFTTLNELRAWLDRLAHEDEHNLIAPRDVDGHVLYRPVASSDEILFDYERAELSAKDYLLPATETLLRVEKQGNEVTLEEVLPDQKQVLFGIRPCDAHGMAALDALFLEQDPPDLYYQHHRERTTLVGLACPQTWEGCFCTSVGGAPDDPTHLDVLFREVDGGYAVEPVTEKGMALLEGLALKERSQKPGFSEKTRFLRPVEVPEPAKWRPLFEDPLWRRHGERCLSCRICTYVCPTCRCFDVTDRVVEVRAGVTHIERIRVWDACTSTNYRRVAGGHNPRPTKPERLRNRFYCKFCYYPEDFGPLGCVGCGRCVVLCPVDIDITEVLHDVAGRSDR